MTNFQAAKNWDLSILGPINGGENNFGKPGIEHHPIQCVGVHQACCDEQGDEDHQQCVCRRAVGCIEQRWWGL